MRKINVFVLIILLTGVIAELSIRNAWLESLENVYADLWHRLAGVRRIPEQVAIVAIDDESLLARQDEPLVFWSPYYAEALKVLRQAGAAVIGIDILFQVSAESWLKKLNVTGNEISRTYDLPMRAQLAAGQVVLAGMLAYNERGEGTYLLPIEDYVLVLPDQLANVGLVNMYHDADGAVRHFVPAFFEEGNVPNLSFAMLLAVRAAGLDPASPGWLLANLEIPNSPTPHRIGFCGPPKTVPRLSLTRLLSPHAEKDPEIQRLKGKVVIIALEHTGTQDIHVTPYSRPFLGFEGESMSGAELHANIVETVLTGRFPRPISSWLRVMYLVLVLSLATFLFLRTSPWQGLAIGLGSIMLSVVPAYLVFLSDRLLPVANLQIALVVSYLATLGFRLTGEERERARLRQIFGRFVSDEVVEHLVAMGANPDLGGETYQVTVLFADIRNFTTISEKLNDPRDVVEMLNAYFSEVSEPILAQGGTIDKFIGDAVMAVFGAPITFADHAQRAIHAALLIQKTAQEFRAWMQTRFPGIGLPEFRIGIGLHTGEAVMGNIGSAKRMEYTAIGDTVNTASRLEGASKTLGWTIVASADTINAAGSEVLTSGHSNISVKGREQEVEVYEVIGVKA